MEAGANKEAKAQGEEDLSMEEILQSIRKIIADDDIEGGKPVADTAKANATNTKGAEPVPGSEVLELTEMVMDDGTVETVKEAAPVDVLSSIDAALPATAKPAEKPVAAAAPAPAPAPKPAPAPAASSQDEIDSLLSAGPAGVATETLKKLQAVEPGLPPLKTTPSPIFYSGETVEGMVVNMLKPMMKEWLDANLPQIVDRIVEREVRKLTKYLTDKGD